MIRRLLGRFGRILHRVRGRRERTLDFSALEIWQRQQFVGKHMLYFDFTVMQLWLWLMLNNRHRRRHEISQIRELYRLLCILRNFILLYKQFHSWAFQWHERGRFSCKRIVSNFIKHSLFLFVSSSSLKSFI